uniref:Uncharacterized protein n=1 Tax=Anguilla anguilla TaxID=7936 RepID=A0A0E9Q6T3_ANGAN
MINTIYLQWPTFSTKHCVMYRESFNGKEMPRETNSIPGPLNSCLKKATPVIYSYSLFNCWSYIKTHI